MGCIRRRTITRTLPGAWAFRDIALRRTLTNHGARRIDAGRSREESVPEADKPEGDRNGIRGYRA